MSGDPRIVFAGTPDFAVVVLDAMVAAEVKPAVVYTQPDRPSGRGRKLTSSPVKRRAAELGLEVRQPRRLDEAAVQALTADAPELMVVVAYGLILPPEVLALPAHGCVNVHASLLPRWRGAAPIQRALLAGDAETGVCLMRMEQGLDTGPVLAERRTRIAPEDDAGTLHDRLARLGGELLVESLPDLLDDALEARPQLEEGVTYARKLDKSEAAIDWSAAAEDIARQVRAYLPWPVAETASPKGRLRIWEAQAESGSSAAVPGTVLGESGEGITVATGRGVLRITRLQLPGRKPVTAGEFLNAASLVDARLGPS